MTVTFLFTDIEGSTRLWERDPAGMRATLARHDRILREAIQRHGGTVFKTGGDAFCAAFGSAPEAVAAAVDAQRALHDELADVAEAPRVRMALHAGAAEARDGDYFGPALNRTARLLAIGHGGQVLLSQTVFDLVRDAAPPDASLVDLGSHRLRDLQRPEQVHQVVHPGLPTDFPPLRSLEAVPHNLPLQLTSFIGRERELADLRELLATTRLLTLTGAGGSGKTRTALQLAADLLDDYPDGIWFLDLAALTDPGLVPQTAASAMGIVEQPGRATLDLLAEQLRSRTLLLVLDNCEHLVEACASLAETLLRACPGVRVLATSRETLNVPGEVAWPVPSLTTPDVRGLPQAEAGSAASQYEAVRLFIDRALLAKPGFEITNENAPAVAQICHQLDGIPLAIELAAARVKVMSVDQIAARLSDRFRLLTGGSRTAFPRHQTLRAAIDWSYALLSEAERVLLRRLSVFASGWSLEAAEAVCAGEGIEPGEVLDVQARLVDKSLIVVDEGVGDEARYRLLGTIRQYAGERLVEAGEAAALRDRHCAWFADLAERGGSELRGSEQSLWLDRLEQEHDNFRAALEWSRAGDISPEVGLRLAGALYRFWFLRGYMREGEQWLAAVLEAGGGSEKARARAVHAAGYLAWGQGDYARARALLEESLTIYHAVDDKRGRARALNSLSVVRMHEGDVEGARVGWDEALLLAREIGAVDLISTLLNNLGETARMTGDLDRARQLYTEALALSSGRNTALNAIAYENLGYIAFTDGNWDAARGFFRQSLEVAGPMGLKGSVAACLAGLGGVTGVQGDSRTAARLMGAAEALRAAINEPVQPSDRPMHERFVAAARQGLGPREFEAAWSEGAKMSYEQALAEAAAASRESAAERA